MIENAAKRRMVDGLSRMRGMCRVLVGLRIVQIQAACSEDELRMWSKTARESAKAIAEFAAKLAPESASGITDDELATNAARYLGSKGGKQGGVKGGKARMETLTADERSALGRRAAAARWGKPETGA